MTTNPTTYEYDVFISYNQHDAAWAEQLATRLEQEDYQNRKLKVFFAPWDIKPGESIPERLEYALPRSRKVCLIMSPESAASEWVKVERYVTHHIDITERQLRLIPLYRRASEIPPFLQHINRIDFQDDAKFEGGYRLLLATIKDEPLPRGEQKPSNAVTNPAPIPRRPVVGFVARRDGEGRDIVERLKAELAPQENQLIVLSGPGGVGKTTLAAETVRALGGVFAQRFVWISALGREDFTLSTLLDDIATQLGRADLRPLRPDAKLEEVRALIAEAPALIILDNFETIAAAEQMSCLGFLSDRAPCPVLITTRPKIASARNIVIPVMSPDEANDFLKRLIDQAGDVSAFASLDRERIMTASDRTPLVMQWVVAQIDLAQEADTVLAELAGGVGDAAERVFERSFRSDLLGDDGRAVLLALSLFTPDASRDALAETAGFGEDVKRLNEAVKRLASLWLVKTSAAGQRLTVEGLTRELAKARLSKDDHATELRQRFVNYFLRYAQAHAEPTPEDYDALEVVKDNVLNAMDVAFGLQDWQSVIRLMDAVSFDGVNGYLTIRGYWDEAIRKGEQALEAARKLSTDLQIAHFSHNLAITYQERGEIAQAKRFYHRALEISKRLDNEGYIAASLHELGRLAQDEGKIKEAKELYNESLEIEKKLQNHDAIALSLHQLAILAHGQGQLEEARRLYNESLEIHKRLGNQGGFASTLHQLAILAQDQSELQEARQLYTESLEIKKRLGNQDGIAGTLHQLGRLAEKEDKKAEAARLFAEALAIFEQLKSPNAEIARRSLERVTPKSS